MRKVLMLVVLVAAAWVVVARGNHASEGVAFMGDSLTEGWAFPRTNFGVHGQTTGEMLGRFAGQVGGHGYRTVVILGGTNDTLLGLDARVTLGNLGAMVDLARSEGVEPVLGEILPIYKEGGKYQEAVSRLDAGIVGLGKAKGVKVVDYYGALRGHPEAYSDGVHLKRRGYLRMEWALLRVVRPF